MRYSEKYKILSSDTDINDVASVSVILKYMQDAAYSNMASGRPSYRELYDAGYAFLLTRITLNILSDLHAGDEITAESWPVPSKGFIFGRDFRILKGGVPVAEAVSEWALAGVGDRRLHRVGEIEMNYGEDDPLAFKIPRFRIDGAALVPCGEHTVTYADCDLNGHMNNTRYPDIFTGCAGDIKDKRVKSITINYLREAPLGSHLTICRAEAEGTHYIRSIKDNGEINAECAVTFKTGGSL